MSENFQKTDIEVTPQMKRERKLELIIKGLSVLVIAQFIGFFLLSAVYVNKPQIPIVIDHETGQIVGNYRTTEQRTQDEMINAGIRFVDHLLSLNSSTIRRDQFIAIGMMVESLQQKRIEYLKDTNLIIDIETAKSTSHLSYIEQNIIFAKGEQMRIEFKGSIILTNLKKSAVPFHIIVDLKNAQITANNTTGVQVESYSDF